MLFESRTWRNLLSDYTWVFGLSLFSAAPVSCPLLVVVSFAWVVWFASLGFVPFVCLEGTYVFFVPSSPCPSSCPISLRSVFWLCWLFDPLLPAGGGFCFLSRNRSFFSPFCVLELFAPALFCVFLGGGLVGLWLLRVSPPPCFRCCVVSCVLLCCCCAVCVLWRCVRLCCALPAWFGAPAPRLSLAVPSGRGLLHVMLFSFCVLCCPFVLRRLALSGGVALCPPCTPPELPRQLPLVLCGLLFSLAVL